MSRKIFVEMDEEEFLEYTNKKREEQTIGDAINIVRKNPKTKSKFNDYAGEMIYQDEKCRIDIVIYSR